LLDEPFSALDTPRRRQLRQTLRALQNEISATTVLVTHDPDEAALLADEILVLDQGRVLQVGATAELFSRPNNLQVAALLGIENIGRGIYLGRGAIDIGAGLQLSIADVEVPRDVGAGTPVLWRIPRRALSVVAEGGYPAQQVNDTRQAGTRILVLDLGGTRLNVESDLPCAAGAELRIAIGGVGLEIWRERLDDSTTREA
jgi:ABC-type Fe3+/spermidine/putrescine transport system ATPase subunit